MTDLGSPAQRPILPRSTRAWWARPSRSIVRSTLPTAGADPGFAAEAGRFVLGDAPGNQRCGCDRSPTRSSSEKISQQFAPLPHRCIDELSYSIGGDGREGPDTYRNPRDGLVTLIALARALTTATRRCWDLGEPLMISLSPSWMPTTTTSGRREWYGTSTGTGAGTRWSLRRRAVIWKESYMIWSGQPGLRTKTSEQALDLPGFESMMPVAGEGRGVDSRRGSQPEPDRCPRNQRSTARRAEPDTPELVYGAESRINQSMGLIVGADGSINHMLEGNACDQPAGRSFTARVRDTRTDEDCEAALVSVTAEVRYTPAPGVRQQTVQLLPLEGRLRACNP